MEISKVHLKVRTGFTWAWHCKFTYDFSTQEVEVGLGVDHHPMLHNEFKPSLGL